MSSIFNSSSNRDALQLKRGENYLFVEGPKSKVLHHHDQEGNLCTTVYERALVTECGKKIKVITKNSLVVFEKENVGKEARLTEVFRHTFDD